MALAKLWNAVFGKRPAADQSPPAIPATSSVVAVTKSVSPVAAVKPIAVKQATEKSISAAHAAVNSGLEPANACNARVVRLSKNKTKAKSRQSKQVEPMVSVAAPEPPAVLRMFRRKTNAWTKLIGQRTINVILDMNIQDGSRAVELLEAIVDSNSIPPKYVAIGMFELAGDKLTVRQFHQKVRAAGGQPVVIPMPLVDGLRRLSQTVGTVDLILLDITEQQLADPMVAKLLQRIAPTRSLILRRDAQNRWVSTSRSHAA